MDLIKTLEQYMNVTVALEDTATQARQELGRRNKPSFRTQQQEAYARSKWHGMQLTAYKGKTDSDSKAAYQAHTDAEYEWLLISQEFMHGNPTLATNLIKKTNEALAKSKLAQADVDADEKIASAAQ